MLPQHLDHWLATFPAKLTAVTNTSGTYLYDWTEQITDGAGGYTNAEPGRSGNSTVDPARELNNLNFTPTNTVVWMRFRGMSGANTVYEFDGTGVNAGSGSGNTVALSRNTIGSAYNLNTSGGAYETIFTQELNTGHYQFITSAHIAILGTVTAGTGSISFRIYNTTTNTTLVEYDPAWVLPIDISGGSMMSFVSFAEQSVVSGATNIVLQAKYIAVGGYFEIHPATRMCLMKVT